MSARRFLALKKSPGGYVGGNPSRAKGRVVDTFGSPIDGL
jgi:hypothetical protein